MKMLTLFLIVLLANSNNYSQTQNQHPFFPHHVGDLWEYTEWEFWGLPLSHFHAIIIADTLDSLGKSHVHFINNVLWQRSNVVQAWPINEFIIDTLNNVYHLVEAGLPYFLIYKLDAQQGDQWVMYTHSPGQYEMARCSKVEMRYIFNQWRETKFYTYYLAFDSTDTTGLARNGSHLADGLGLIYDGGNHDVGYELRLGGAVIGGILYGDTTYLNVHDPSSSQSVLAGSHLYQNYPNPFNSTTRISFDLHEEREIALSFYDLNGKLIKTIYKGILGAGTHTYHLDVSDLSSGIYIYSIKTGPENYQKKCILIK